MWARQIGTAAYDASWGVSLDNESNAYISGFTAGVLDDPAVGIGSSQAFLAKYDDAGTLLWTRQFGSFASSGTDTAVDEAGNAYVKRELARWPDVVKTLGMKPTD